MNPVAILVLADCARAFDAEEGVAHADVKVLEEYHDHPSIRGLLTSGYQVITF